MAALRQRWKIAVTVGVAGLALLAWLAFGYFGVHTLFVDKEVAEAPPVFQSGTGASGSPGDAISDELAKDMTTAMDEEGLSAEAEVDEQSATGDVVTLRRGEFIDRSHPAQGIALVLSDGSGQRFLRFEDFSTDNGPDLNVYLSTAAPDAPADQLNDDFIDLGDLKGNVGPQNYEIPPSADLDRYRTVVIWCVRFSVAFGAAPLDA